MLYLDLFLSSGRCWLYLWCSYYFRYFTRFGKEKFFLCLVSKYLFLRELFFQAYMDTKRKVWYKLEGAQSVVFCFGTYFTSYSYFIGLSLIERPILISHLNLKLIQICWTPPPHQQVSTLVRSCNINFLRPIFMHKWTHFMQFAASLVQVAEKHPPPFLHFCEQPGLYYTCGTTLAHILQIHTQIPPT